jgi:Protein of unknown function (DUF4232)
MLRIPSATRPARGCRAVPLPLAAAVTVAAAGLLTACGSASAPRSGATPAGGATASSNAAQPTSSVPVSSPGTARSTPPGTHGLAVCQSSSLRVTVDTSQAGGAAGSTYYPVNFTNASGAPCAMYGYPGVSFVSLAGSAARQIGAAAQRNPTFAKLTVRLPAGGIAHAWLQVALAGNYPASDCQPVTAHWLRVFPPGETVAIYVNHVFDACASANAPLLTVMPVRSGKGVQGITP